MALGRQGQHRCLVDFTDWLWICHVPWNYHYKHWYERDRLYARRNVGRYRETVYLHREILKLADPRSTRYMNSHLGDHRNGNTLDNRRCNLRWATHRQNVLNRHSTIPTLEEIMAANPNPIEPEIPF